jgi:hypothetical protein
MPGGLQNDSQSRINAVWPAASALRDVRRNTPSFVPRQEVCRRSPSSVGFKVDVRQCHSVIVAHNETTLVVLFDVPWRRWPLLIPMVSSKFSSEKEKECWSYQGNDRSFVGKFLSWQDITIKAFFETDEGLKDAKVKVYNLTSDRLEIPVTEAGS